VTDWKNLGVKIKSRDFKNSLDFIVNHIIRITPSVIYCAKIVLKNIQKDRKYWKG
jgi:hypothetical protein